MYGKIINNQLVIAGERIPITNGWITKPTEQELRMNGYKEVQYSERPEYDKEEEKITEVYNEYENRIVVLYATDQLTDDEHNEIIKQEIIEEEAKLTPRRQREFDLKKEGAEEFVQTIENNIIALRKKFR